MIMDRKKHREGSGLTILELLVALALSALLITLLYRTFVSQQKTYVVQERVIDMNQSARAVVSQIIGEIRMAGFGRVAGEFVPVVGYVPRILPVQFTGSRGESVVYRNVLNRDVIEMF
jgi:Tfp pilus assembly protein PilW